MTPEQFVYWLQGCLEITDPKSLGEKEIQIIKDHIALVLKKETPVRQPTLAEQFAKQGALPKSSGRFLCVVCGGDHGNLPCPATKLLDVAVC